MQNKSFIIILVYSTIISKAVGAFKLENPKFESLAANCEIKGKECSRNYSHLNESYYY